MYDGDMITADTRSKAAFRLLCLYAPIVLVCCLFIPVRNRSFNVAIVVTFFLSAAGCLIEAWRRVFIRYALLLLLLLPVALLALPARSSRNLESLSEAYTNSLRKYAETKYWWGGETRIGIDCSGLIRAAMMDACLIEGVKTFDGGLLRHAADLWWHDESAGALGNSYRNLTTPVAKAKSLNKLDHALVRSGDLAIAGGGCHILAYLGHNQWIQADPGAGRVIIEQAPSVNAWFLGDVKIVRWGILNGGAQ